MAIGGLWPYTPFRFRRDVRKTARFSAGGNFNPAITAGFGDGATRPIAGFHIIRTGIRRGKVQGHQRQLRHGAAMHEQNPVARRQTEKRGKARHGGGSDLLEDVAREWHFHNRQAVAVPVQQFVTGVSQHLLRHHGRAGGKIKQAWHDQKRPRPKELETMKKNRGTESMALVREVRKVMRAQRARSAKGAGTKPNTFF